MITGKAPETARSRTVVWFWSSLINDRGERHASRTARMVFILTFWVKSFSRRQTCKDGDHHSRRHQFSRASTGLAFRPRKPWTHSMSCKRFDQDRVSRLTQFQQDETTSLRNGYTLPDPPVY
uniref:Secreted protein n=1 Tax=Panagrellus redivivus TaxID=6233 RepID=A0A7E4W2B9_PANRE